MRVEPVTTSGPTTGLMMMSVFLMYCLASGAQVTKMVFAPRC